MLLGGAEVVPLQTRNGYTIDGRRGNVGPDHFLVRCGGAYGASSIARIIVLLKAINCNDIQKSIQFTIYCIYYIIYRMKCTVIIITKYPTLLAPIP